MPVHGRSKSPSAPAVFTTQPSGQRLPRSTARPPSGDGRMIDVRIGAVHTVAVEESNRVALCAMHVGNLLLAGRRGLCRCTARCVRSMSSRVKSTSADWAMARMCSTVLVEPWPHPWSWRSRRLPFGGDERGSTESSESSWWAILTRLAWRLTLEQVLAVGVGGEDGAVAEAGPGRPRSGSSSSWR